MSQQERAEGRTKYGSVPYAAPRQPQPRQIRHGIDKRPIRVGFVGNPNCGKTTLFNAFTGAKLKVANWPGVTVERVEGETNYKGRPIKVIDLPGIYSLTSYTIEEKVTRKCIEDGEVDVIINVVDASSMERNLYLTAQLLELERPMVIALNFMDEVEKHGDHIDVAGLSKALGVPVIPITARSGENIQTLLEAAHRQMHVGVTIEPDDLYDGFTHQIHHKVGELIHDKAYAAHIPAHWASIKLIEGDALVEKALGLSQRERDELEAVCREYEGAYDLGDRETLIADARYQFIQTVVAQCVRRGRPLGAPTLSDRIDAIVTHKVLAIPVFLLMMLCMFALTFGPGQMLADGVDALIGGWFAGGVRSLLAAAGTAPWVEALLVDGVIAGVGGVLTFLPQATTCVLSFITALVTGKVTFQGVDVKAALIPTLLVVFLATLAAGYFQTVGQKNVEPSRCAIIFSLESVFACIASVVMGYEPLTTNLVAGGLIIVTSIIISELPSKADRRQARLVKQMRQEKK